MKGLKRLAGGGLLLLELRGMRRELADLKVALSRIATALEERNAHEWPQQVPQGDLPAVEVSYADDVVSQEMMQVELDLTNAKGMPPSEDEILLEYERRKGIRT